MMKRILKIGAMLLCVLMLTALLHACAQKNDPFTITGFPSLTIEKKQTLKAVVNLNLSDVEAHSGEVAHIYELLPGEGLTAIDGKEPLAQAKIGSEMIFEFPLHDGEHTRLYSTFAVCYENGSLLIDDARVIDHPETLASCNAAFGGCFSPKGLTVSDVEQAVDLGVSHAMLEVSVPMLCNGRGESYRFDGEEYTFSASALRTLDKRVRDSYAAGMQVSLRMNFDSIGEFQTVLAILNLLSSRYANEANGVVTAFFIDSINAANAASFAVLANTALTSHVKNGRVYVVSKTATVSDTEAFFTTVAKRIANCGDFAWGAAFSLPRLNTHPWESNEEDTLDLHALSPLVDTLSGLDGNPVYYAMCDLSFDASDTDVQAVSLAYAYAKAVESDMGLIYYGTQNDSNGFYDPNGEERLSANVFRRIDIGLDTSQIYLCKSVSDMAWSTIETLRPSRTVLDGNGSVGYGVGRQESLFDFSDGKTFDFIAIGSTEDSQIRDSAAWKKPVLYTWLDPKQGETGVRKLMQNGQALTNASALTVRFLAQYKEEVAESCTLTLSLVGIDSRGETVSYTANAPFNAKKWQTVTFDVSEFTARADLSQACSLTVLCEPDAECDENFVLFVKDVSAYYPQDSSGILLPILLTLAGVLIGFLLIFILYRRARIFRRRRRG